MLVTTLLFLALSLVYCFATCLLFCHLLIVLSLVTCYYFVVCRLSLVVALLFVACCLLFHYLLLATPLLFACCFIVYYLQLSHLLLPHFVAFCFIVLLLITSPFIASLLCLCLFRWLCMSFCCLLFIPYVCYQLPTPWSFYCSFATSFVAWLVVGACTHDLGVHVQVVECGTFEPTNSIFLVGFFFFFCFFVYFQSRFLFFLKFATIQLDV